MILTLSPGIFRMPSTGGLMEYTDYFPHVREASEWFKKRIKITPRVVVVLSGGLDPFIEGLSEKTTFVAGDIPHFPVSRVEGHAGKLHIGTYQGVPLIAMQGRQHYYEGYTPQQIVFPYFVFNQLGATFLITTNAVGGINFALEAGDIMMVTDHLNLMEDNPLRGIAIQRQFDQFTSMIDAYDPALRELAQKIAMKEKMTLKEGIFAGVSGPNYETPAEIRMLRALGADAVGMSTVFEVIAARFLAMRVLTFNAIANPAADRHECPMSHTNILQAMEAMSPKLVRLLQEIVASLK